MVSEAFSDEVKKIPSGEFKEIFEGSTVPTDIMEEKNKEPLEKNYKGYKFHSIPQSEVVYEVEAHEAEVKSKDEQ